MKWGFIASLILTLGGKNLSASPTVIYLYDPNDKEISTETKADASETETSKSDEKQASKDEASKPKEPESLDDIIEQVRNRDATLTKKQKRIVDQIKQEQQEFLRLLDEFITVPFDADDEMAIPEFKKVRDRLGDLVFNAPTERDYYQRLYLINDLWLSNSKELPRFGSLDKYMMNRATEFDEKRRRYQAYITGGASLVGFAVGGFGSLKWSEKLVPIAATDKGFSIALKWAQRAPVIITGAAVGALIGRYAGFLGSDYIFRRMGRPYTDPIDGTEDLRDLLDVIDGL